MDPPATLDVDALAELLERRQSGVVSRRQLRELGATAPEVRRLLRRRELVLVHPGVYVDHTGSLTWQQRAVAAVLACWPSALTRESALPHPPPTAPIQVAVADSRTLRPPTGVLVHRMSDLDDRVDWMRTPPRVRVEHAALDVAVARIGDPAAAFRLLADVCQTGRTSATRLESALASRTRIVGRELLVDMLADLRTGACSVLEREWLRLERLHGLPAGERQLRSRAGGRTTVRDVDLPDLRLVIELDGRAFHDTAAARDADAERDLDAAVADDALTVRLTYGQVFGRGCHTVRRVAALMAARGWTGVVVRCPACPGAD